MASRHLLRSVIRFSQVLSTARLPHPTRGITSILPSASSHPSSLPARLNQVAGFSSGNVCYRSRGRVADFRLDSRKRNWLDRYGFELAYQSVYACFLWTCYKYVKAINSKFQKKSQLENMIINNNKEIHRLEIELLRGF